jgi:hypothetical protein
MKTIPSILRVVFFIDIGTKINDSDRKNQTIPKVYLTPVFINQSSNIFCIRNSLTTVNIKVIKKINNNTSDKFEFAPAVASGFGCKLVPQFLQNFVD